MNLLFAPFLLLLPPRDVDDEDDGVNVGKRRLGPLCRRSGIFGGDDESLLPAPLSVQQEVLVVVVVVRLLVDVVGKKRKDSCMAYPIALVSNSSPYRS